MILKTIGTLVPITICVLTLLYVIHEHDDYSVYGETSLLQAKHYCLEEGYPNMARLKLGPDTMHYCLKSENGSSVVHKVPN